MRGMTYLQIIRHFGSAIKAARALGYTKQAVYWWRDHGVPLRVEVLCRMHMTMPGGKNAKKPVRRDP